MTNPLAKKLPFHINICEAGVPAFQKASALIRMGYVFAPDIPVRLTDNGNAIFTLLLGTPEHHTITAANEAVSVGIMMEESAYEQAVESRAKMLLEEYKREQIAKQVKAEIAEHEKKIAEIQKAADAAAEKLK